MRALPAVTILALLVPAMLFAHAGEVHTYMGTVTALHEGGSFTMKKTDGTEIQVQTDSSTRFVHADDRPASLRDLGTGTRVVVKMSTDGRTAISVKMKTARG